MGKPARPGLLYDANVTDRQAGEDLAGRIRNVRFTTTRLRTGYDEPEVDRFLDEIEAAAGELSRQIGVLRALLAGAPSREDAAAAAAELAPPPELTPERVRAKRFSRIRVRPGYATDQVDRFLEGTAAELEFLAAERDVLLKRLSR